MLESEQTLADERTKDRERVMGQADSESAVDVPVSAMVASHAETPLAGVVIDHVMGADELTPRPRRFKVIGHEEVCGLLIEQLQDVSVFLHFSHCLVIARL
jgi:hypothetical protein